MRVVVSWRSGTADSHIFSSVSRGLNFPRDIFSSWWTFLRNTGSKLSELRKNPDDLMDRYRVSASMQYSKGPGHPRVHHHWHDGPSHRDLPIPGGRSHVPWLQLTTTRSVHPAMQSPVQVSPGMHTRTSSILSQLQSWKKQPGCYGFVNSPDF